MVKEVKSGGNRFLKGVGEQVAASETGGPRPLRNEVLRFSRQEFEAFSGQGNQMFAAALSVQEGIDMFEAIKQIKAAKDFNMAFKERVMKNPVLKDLFTTWIQAVRRTGGTEPQKLASGEYIFNQIEVEAWMDSVAAALEKLRASHLATPIDVAAVGLEIIDRKAELLKLAPKPMDLAPTLSAMASVQGLTPEAQRFFYTQLANMAIKHVAKVDTRTDADLVTSLRFLRTAISGLIKAGETKKVVDGFMKEAQRIGAAKDGETGRAEQIRTSGILLGTSDKNAPAAEADIERFKNELLETVFKKQSENVALEPHEIDTFRALLEVSEKARKLFEQMPEIIESIMLHPKLAKPSTGGDDQAAQTKKYTPSAEELAAFQELTKNFIAALGRVYPGKENVNDAHKELCKKSQTLIAKCLIMNDNQSENVSRLVQQFTRHEDLALDAANLVDPTFISDQTQRLDACQGLVVSALENENIDAAKHHFDNRFTEDDGYNKYREAEIMAKAAEVVNRTKGTVDGEPPALQWVMDAHTQGLDAAFVSAPPNLDAANQILKIMSTDYEDWTLQARDSLNLVNQVLGKIAGWKNYFELHPALIQVVGRFPEDDACKEKAKELLQAFTKAVGTTAGPVDMKASVPDHTYRLDDAALRMMEVIAPMRELNGFVVSIAEAFLAKQPLPESGGKYAESVLRMQAPPGLKERLAYLFTDEKIDTLTQDQVSRIALAWGAEKETHQRAREIIVQFDAKHRPTEVAKLPADVQFAYVRMEGAVRLAVPNLMSEKTAVDLAAGFRAPNKVVKAETLMQVAKYMPRDLIDMILKNADLTEAAEVIKTRLAALEKGEEEQPPAAPAQT